MLTNKDNGWLEYIWETRVPPAPFPLRRPEDSMTCLMNGRSEPSLAIICWKDFGWALAL